jgi:hypothetical protein
VLRAFRDKLLLRVEALEKLQVVFTAGRINTRIHQVLVDVVQRESSQADPGDGGTRRSEAEV